MSLLNTLKLCGIVCLAFCTSGLVYSEEEEISVEKTSNYSGTNNDERVTYIGNQVWKVYLENDEKKSVIKLLAHQSEISTWGGNATNVDIMVSPSKLEEVALKLRENTINYEVMIEDLQKAIDEENPSVDDDIIELQDRKGHPLNWISYHRTTDIYSFLKYVASAFPKLCTLKNIGTSVEGRSLLVMKISNGNPENKRIWIDGGIHAREWISPATVTYIINHLTDNFADLDPALQKIDWHILALANPDGYEFTFTSNRIWRKNRAKNFLCKGVDLNRNFGYAWGGKGTSKNPCEEIYGGNSAFSEPESIAMRDYLLNAGFIAYISLHSYGQYILYPWGYDKEYTCDKDQLDDVGNKMAQAMLRAEKSRYKVGSSAQMLYPASGGSDDWAKGAAGIKYAYTIELRDTGRYGFVLPASLIKPTANEAFAAVEALAKVIVNN